MTEREISGKKKRKPLGWHASLMKEIRRGNLPNNPTYRDVLALEVRRGRLHAVLVELLSQHSIWLRSGGRYGKELDLSPESLYKIAGASIAEVLVKNGFPSPTRGIAPPPVAPWNRRRGKTVSSEPR